MESLWPLFEVEETTITDSYGTVEKDHGQIETRRYEVRLFVISLGYAKNSHVHHVC